MPVNGVATFADLTINHLGDGYRLAAASTGLAGTTSDPFSVTPAAPCRACSSRD